MVMNNFVDSIRENVRQIQFQAQDADIGNEITGEMLLNRNILEIPSLLEPLLPKVGLACLAEVPTQASRLSSVNCQWRFLQDNLHSLV